MLILKEKKELSTKSFFCILNYSNQIKDGKILKKRWENIEKYIIKDFDLAILYVKQVLCENWVDLEEKLIERRKARKIYSYFFATKKCKLPEILHNFMLAKSIENNKHAIKYIKELSHGNV